MPSSSSPLSFVEKEPWLLHGRARDQIDEHRSECKNSAASTFSVGLRVVRGTDWPSDDNESDGGEGFLGTVVEVGSNSSSVAEDMAAIQWDIGTRAVYTAAYHGHYDLCVLNNSSVGKKTTLFFIAVD